MSGREIIGYLLAEQTFCAHCIHDLFVPFFELIASSSHSTEDVLDLVAEGRDINRQDENSFTTYQFPKSLFLNDRLDHERCVYCGRSL